MKRMLILSLSILISGKIFAVDQLTKSGTASPIQEITVSNMLWNQNATGGLPGLTPSSIVVAFKNGGAKPCYSTTLAYKSAITILVGTGQPCVAAVTTISVTPVMGPAGTVYAVPSDIVVNGIYYMNQILISNGTDPLFDTTNGTVKTQGAVQATVQSS